MTEQERANASKIILQVISSLQSDKDSWVDLASIGAPLTAKGIQYKELGFLKLRLFLNNFEDVLEFDEKLVEGKPPVCYVRPKFIVKDDDMTAEYVELSDKHILTDEKRASFAMGYVPNIKGAISHLSKKVGRDITQDELDIKLKESLDNNNVLYYEYNTEGDLVNSEKFSNKTAVQAINTGFKDGDGRTVYAQYNKTTQGWVGVFFNTRVQIENVMNTYKIGRLTFKNYAHANKFIESLQEVLLPGEVWKYAEPAKNCLRKKTTYEILESYLRSVLAVLMQEYNKPESLNYGKIRFSKDKNYALFNTGLLSKYATDVIIVGEVFPKNGYDSGRFNISNPVMLSQGKTELESKGFRNQDATVDMVSFFYTVSQIVYDATAEVDKDDIKKLHHCIDEGIKRDRFPQKCKEQYNQGHLEDLTGDFIKAIVRAERIARRNYKYVIPQCRTSKQGNEIQFLMPIYMLSKYDESPDFALVLSESEIDGQKFYKPETVLELAWAYNNARVICKPDNMWLNPDRIVDSEEVEDDYMSND